jgi:uncharacterized protein
VSASLPDVNVLVALAWPSHIHHRLAADWFGSPAAKPWATCPFTQSGFIRVSSNPGIVDPAVSPAEARAVLRQLTGLQQHQFWANDLDFMGDDLPFELVMGHRQVTDAYLLGQAIARDGRLVTLDRGIPDLLPAASSHRQRIVLLTG